MLKILSIVFVLLCCPAAHAVELKILTKNGYVAFTVPDEWTVLAMKTLPPVAVAAFQIPNPADKDTNESTNLAISFYFIETEEGRAAAKKASRQYGTAAPKVEKLTGDKLKDWTVERQEPQQGAVQYTVLEAKRGGFPEVEVGVLLAWPHLENNPPGYDKQMEESLHAVLESISVGVGPYRPRPGEVVRRP